MEDELRRGGLKPRGEVLISAEIKSGRETNTSAKVSDSFLMRNYSRSPLRTIRESLYIEGAQPRGA